MREKKQKDKLGSVNKQGTNAPHRTSHRNKGKYLLHTYKQAWKIQSNIVDRYMYIFRGYKISKGNASKLSLNSFGLPVCLLCVCLGVGFGVCMCVTGL